MTPAHRTNTVRAPSRSPAIPANAIDSTLAPDSESVTKAGHESPVTEIRTPAAAEPRTVAKSRPVWVSELAANSPFYGTTKETSVVRAGVKNVPTLASARPRTYRIETWSALWTTTRPRTRSARSASATSMILRGSRRSTQAPPTIPIVSAAPRQEPHHRSEWMRCAA